MTPEGPITVRVAEVRVTRAAPVGPESWAVFLRQVDDDHENNGRQVTCLHLTWSAAGLAHAWAFLRAFGLEPEPATAECAPYRDPGALLWREARAELVMARAPLTHGLGLHWRFYRIQDLEDAPR